MRSRRAAALAGIGALAAAFGAFVPRARAWGDKGHEMTARVAARKLPRDMPAFFRQAEVELGYLCPEPDRWRNEKREPALKGLADRDHVFKLEDAILPLPPTRYEFYVALRGQAEARRRGDDHPPRPRVRALRDRRAVRDADG
jgi:hypothetical protein